MTTTISNRSSSARARSLFGLFFARQGGFPEAPRHSGLGAALRKWLSQRRAVAELSRLSDRELSDIGLSRQDIPDAVQLRRRF